MNMSLTISKTAIISIIFVITSLTSLSARAEFVTPRGLGSPEQVSIVFQPSIQHLTQSGFIYEDDPDEGGQIE